MISNEDYEDWLLDATRDPYRILLIELDHSAGTVHLASDWWMSDTLQPYDDWIQGEPYMEDTLKDFKSVGDVEAINGDRSELDWLSLLWRGYQGRWYFGDKTWKKETFKRIATTMIEGCRSQGGIKVIFDLMDGGQVLNRTFLTEEYTSTISGVSTIEFIIAESGLAPGVIFQNVIDKESRFQINHTMAADATALAEIKKLTDTIGAYTRFSQTGELEVFIPEITATPRILTSDDIRYGSIEMVELIPAYKNVRVKLYDGADVTLPTGADTGDLSETLTFDTVLSRVQDATVSATTRANYHSVKHVVWRLEVLDIAGFLQVGDDVEIQDAELSGVGILTSIHRSPLSPFTVAEIEI